MKTILKKLVDPVYKLLKGLVIVPLRTITSELFWQSLFLLSPVIFIGCYPVLSDIFTQKQTGLLFQVFAIIPIILEVWERAHRSTWHFEWYAMSLHNWLNYRGWASITIWFAKRQRTLGKWISFYLMSVSILFYVIGLLLQLFIE